MHPHPFPSDVLRRWFLVHKRDLPWRALSSPYHVWVSEVMLQQTQVATVLPYFERWMRAFPTIAALAIAQEEQVIKLWEGLGYYARVRALHRGAQMVMRDYGGNLPCERAHLERIPGLGPYTVAAILNFAFHKRSALVDGNVVRVLARFYAIEECVDSVAVQTKIRTLAEQLLPEHEPWVVAEALMELGAMVCKKNPACGACPLQADCKAAERANPLDYPKKRLRPTVTALVRTVAVIYWQSEKNVELLIKKGVKGRAMAGLYEFPFLEGFDERYVPLREFEETLAVKLTLIRKLPKQTHSFTRYRVTLHPYLFKADAKNEQPWVSQERLNECAFSAGHKRILDLLRNWA